MRFLFGDLCVAVYSLLIGILSWIILDRSMSGHTPTPPEPATSDDDDNKVVHLSFADWSSLSRHIVWMPDHAETGCGARVASCSTTKTELTNHHVLLRQTDQRPDSRPLHEILEDFKTAEGPLELAFGIPQQSRMIEEEKKVEDVVLGGETNNNPNAQLLSSYMSQLKGWGSRMMQEHVQNNNPSIPITTNNNARFTSAALDVQSSIPRESALTTNDDNDGPAIYLHSSVGAYFRLDEKTSITTTGLLSIRTHPTEACAPTDFRYQWYHQSSSDNNNNDQEWIPLPGATLPSLQPCSTLIGYRLQCRGYSITTDEEEEEALWTCSTPGVVAADPALWKGIQKTRAGTTFAGFQLLQNKQQQSLRLSIVPDAPMVQIQSNSDSDACADLRNLQVTPMHENSKQFNLEFALSSSSQDQDTSAWLLQYATSVKASRYRLSLAAPNRMVRESFLLAWGLVQHQSKFPDIQPTRTTILYPHEPAMPTLSTDTQQDDKDSKQKESKDAGDKGAQKIETKTDNAKDSPFQSQDDAQPGSSPAVPLSLSLSTSSSSASSPRQQPQQQQQPVTPAGVSSEASWPSPLTIASTTSPRASTPQQRRSDEKDNSMLLQQQLRMAQAQGQRKDQIIAELTRQLQAAQQAQQTMQEQHREEVTTLQDQHAKDKQHWQKTRKSLQNEMAVWQARVDARDAKLTQLAQLQQAVQELQATTTQQEALQQELQASQALHVQCQQDLKRWKELEVQVQEELQKAHESIQNLEQQVSAERQKSQRLQQDMRKVEERSHVFQMERNQFKAKHDSLRKEIASLGGGTSSLKDIQEILDNHAVLQDQITELQRQKKQALEDVTTYRTLYEQAKLTSLQLDGDGGKSSHDLRKAIERNVELERLVSEMTEYVTAKDMQVDTLNQVNAALQEEIRSLARASFQQNDV